MLLVFVQGFALNYSRDDALRTRKVMRNALIDVIENGRHRSTEWNVKIVLQTTQKLRPPAKRHRKVRLKVGPRKVVDRS